MCQKNMTKWKKKWKIQRLKQFIEDFSLFIKQCYCVVWSVENLQKVKTQTMCRLKMEKQCFYRNSLACNSKKLGFIKEQGASGLLSSFGIKTPLSRIPLVGPLLL